MVRKRIIQLAVPTNRFVFIFRTVVDYKWKQTWPSDISYDIVKLISKAVFLSNIMPDKVPKVFLIKAMLFLDFWPDFSDHIFISLHGHISL